MEVNLKEGDEPPEQHLDDGEYIERVNVPLSELYDKLKGMFSSSRHYRIKLCQHTQHSPRRMARSWTPGMWSSTSDSWKMWYANELDCSTGPLASTGVVVSIWKANSTPSDRMGYFRLRYRRIRCLLGRRLALGQEVSSRPLDVAQETAQSSKLHESLQWFAMCGNPSNFAVCFTSQHLP